MPLRTRLGIAAFNLITGSVSWLLVKWQVEDIIHPPCYYPYRESSGPTGTDYMALLILLIAALSVTAAFGLSLCRTRWAGTFWHDAQLRVAWILCATAGHGVFYVALDKQGDFRHLITTAGILAMAIMGSLCAAKTRLYIK
jgi:hypothetical protein